VENTKKKTNKKMVYSLSLSQHMRQNKPSISFNASLSSKLHFFYQEKLIFINLCIERHGDLFFSFYFSLWVTYTFERASRFSSWRGQSNGL